MTTSRSKYFRLHAFSIVVLLAALLATPVLGNGLPAQQQEPPNPDGNLSVAPIFLPVVSKAPRPVQQIHAAYFANNIEFSQAAISWFGWVNEFDNYADMRVAYNPSGLNVRLSIFDRMLWYDNTPSRDEMVNWDAVSLYIKTDGNRGTKPTTTTYRFDGQLYWWEENNAASYRTSYQGNGAGFYPAAIPFTAKAGWRGNAPNDTTNDRGWVVTFNIPFASLGLSGAPAQGTRWGMGLALHDRDSQAGPPLADKTWPVSLDKNVPNTWGQVSFGPDQYNAPVVSNTSTTTIRHKLNGVTAIDGVVGGNTNCGDGLNFWTQWGLKSYPGEDQINVQNQSDVADWPCYSKFYITLPLDQIPANVQIVNASITLFLFGNAGGGSYGDPPDSLIQVLEVQQDFLESNLAWNNAPLPMENLSQIWVQPVVNFPGWPGIPYSWDVSQAVARAKATGQPLRLVFYSADAAYHTGKYFITADTGDWNATGRPTLEVTWGQP